MDRLRKAFLFQYSFYLFHCKVQCTVRNNKVIALNATLDRHVIRIGTRRSPLALRQAEITASALQKQGIKTQIFPILSDGDRTKKPLRFLEGKGLFVKNLEQSLLEGDIDVAVHSYKDMPYQETSGLVISGVLAREDPRDALLSCSDKTSSKDFSGRIGTCALRRYIQLKVLYPQAKIRDIRGNINTRIGKMKKGEIDALVLAMAGLKRLNLTHHVQHIFSIEECIPSPTQGILALQCRVENKDICALLALCTHHPTRRIAEIERGFVTAIAGHCDTPVGGHAWIEEEILHFKGVLSNPDGTGMAKIDVQAPLDDIGAFFKYGQQLGHTLKEKQEQMLSPRL